MLGTQHAQALVSESLVVPRCGKFSSDGHGGQAGGFAGAKWKGKPWEGRRRKLNGRTPKLRWRLNARKRELRGWGSIFALNDLPSRVNLLNNFEKCGIDRRCW